MIRSLLTLLAAGTLAAAPAAAQDCTQSRVVHGALLETSSGPYDPGDTFEATLQIWSPTAGEDVGVSTVVLDYNNAAISFAASPVEGTDYEYLRYDGAGRPTVDNASATYASDVRVTNPSRIVPLVELTATTSGAGRAEAMPTTPTNVLRLRWTVVDATQGIVVTPHSQQVYNGPGGPAACYTNGTWTGVEAGQQVIAGTSGWRMLGAPAGDLTTDVLAGLNLVQGVPGHFPTSAANLYVGYTGTAYGTAPAAGTPIAPGLGFVWYFYAPSDFPGTPPPTFAPLPMTVHHAGPSAASFRSGSELGAPSVALPLHTAGNTWNLIANPFATALDVSQIAPTGGTFASAVVQTWDVGPGGVGSYVLSSTEGDRVAGWQGFYLDNATATGASIPSAARTTGATFHDVTDSPTNTPADARTADARALLPFTLDGVASDGTPLFDRAIVLALDDTASPDWDLFDARKLTPMTPSYAALAFVGDRDGAPVLKAQDARPVTEEGFGVPLVLDVAGADASLTLRWDLSALPDDLPIALRDMLTGDHVDLRATDRYDFTSAATSPARTLAPGTSLDAAHDARFQILVGNAVIVSTTPGAQSYELALLAPSPNPVRDRVRLRFTLAESTPVRLALYDVLGREVALVESGDRPAGAHDISLSTAGLASGIYVVRLDAGGETLTRRLTVAR